MLTFWIIASGLILLALILVVPPFFKKIPAPINERNQLNLAIYRERLAELEQPQLADEQRELVKQELDKMLVQDLQEETPPPNLPRARWASLVIVVGLPLMVVGTYLKLGSPHLLAPAAQKQSEKLPAEFDQMVTKLAARLAKAPNDEEGWRMLARSYAVLGDYAQTVKTYNTYLSRFGEQPEVLTDFAEFLAKSNGNQLAGLPSLLLKTALSINSNYQDALWLAGLAAAQKEDFKTAIEYWERFLGQLPPSEMEARKLVEQHIAEARHQLAPTTTNPAATQKETTNQPSIKIKVQVSLASSLQDQVKPDDTLFIYARATQGPPMPLAIVKKLARDLPLTVILEDSMAMAPAMKLSNYQEVAILARISKSASATLQSGDLQGEFSPLKVGKQEEVKIVINQVIP